METILSGWITKNIYPVLAKSEKNKLAEDFLKSQAENVRELLAWESKRFLNAEPSIDPLQRKIIPTRDPRIRMSCPKGWRRGVGNNPWFYNCPKCNGRLFWGLNFCPWCGIPPAQYLDPGDGHPETYLNLVEYLYPQSSKPEITQTLAALEFSNLLSDDGLKVSKEDMIQMLKDIDKYIPKKTKKRRK